MNEKTIAAIALSNRDFDSFAAKVAEAAVWVDHAANNGAHLALLPEVINKYRGDGPGNARALTFAEMALDDWQRDTAPLFEVARRRNVAVCIPVLVREHGVLFNSMFLVSGRGEVLGRYDKMRPTPAELDQGVVPGGAQQLMEWDGLKIGGAICFDTLFQEVFRTQAALGADLFLVGSYWPGGSHLNFYAMTYSAPVVLAYPAWSRIIDITGHEIAAAGYRSETLRFGFGTPIAMATINFDRVALYGNINQERIVEIERKYGRKARVTFDQQNVLFFLESRAADLTVRDLIQEFGLVPFPKYVAECEELVLRQSAAPVRG
jgi:predicted amidohydrolase